MYPGEALLVLSYEIRKHHDSFLMVSLYLLNSLVDSIHGGPGYEGMSPLDQHSQLFASSGAIKFPILPSSEAWKEKVCSYGNICQNESLNLRFF